MDILRYSYPRILGRSKNLAYKAKVEGMTTELMRFLKENELIIVDPFDANGALRADLEVRNSDLTELGKRIFGEYFPKWSAYVDRGGDMGNVKILENGLSKLRKL